MVILSTQLGPVRGTTDGTVSTFLGLRYAQPPTGQHRFAPPRPIEPRADTFDATEFPNRAIQPPTPEILGPPEPGELDEDCLFLNIFAPTAQSAELRPVLVWIHGGGYALGSANNYDGSILARQGDVVIVAINYRLGLLGFLDLSPFGPDYAGSASNGFLDQIESLRWVRDNIADYGGNPELVTIFGESAGGGSVLSLLACPAADGLYHRAIAHSPGGASGAPIDHRPFLSNHFGCEADQLLDRLLEATSEEILTAQQSLPQGIDACVDGVVQTRAVPEAIVERGHAGVPLIAGTNLDEGTLFSHLMGQDEELMELIGPAIAHRFLGDDVAPNYLAGLRSSFPEDAPLDRFHRIWLHLFRRPATLAAAAASQAGPGGWVYRFELASTTHPELGATHASEISFTFNAFAQPEEAPTLFHHLDDPVASELSRRWSATVLHFARTGDPNGAGLPAWPRYTPSSDSKDHRITMVLDANPRCVEDLDAADRALWGDEPKSAGA